MSHLAIYGNGYLANFRQAGEIVQLGLLHPERIRPELERGRLRFRYSPPSGPQQLRTEADGVHVKGLSVDGLTTPRRQRRSVNAASRACATRRGRTASWSSGATRSTPR